MNAYKRLKSLRKSRNLSQKEMGELIGTSGNYYGDSENGKRDIPISRMKILADYFEVSIDYLIGVADSKTETRQYSMSTQQMIDSYLQLSERNKGKVEQLIADLLESQK